MHDMYSLNDGNTVSDELALRTCMTDDGNPLKLLWLPIICPLMRVVPGNFVANNEQEHVTGGDESDDAHFFQL